MTPTELNRLIDHMLLRPDTTRRDARNLCHEARRFGCASALILPAWVADGVDIVEGSPTAIATVIGFPHGNAPAQSKAAEAATAVADGATEVAMVINISALKSGADLLVVDEIQSVVDACAPGEALVTVILESVYLTDDEKRRATRMALEMEADFVQTGTGFAPAQNHEALLNDLRMLRLIAGDEIGIKATFASSCSSADAQAFLEAGANRLVLPHIFDL